MTTNTDLHGAMPENIREGAPYDDPRFADLCREYQIWGTPQSALCAVFWRAAIEQAAVPEGWKLVKIEPTEAMIRAGEKHTDNYYSGDDDLANAWGAMLAASPAPTKQQPALGRGEVGGVTLSDEQIQEWIETVATYDVAGWRLWGFKQISQFVRAIEAAHGIKEAS